MVNAFNTLGMGFVVNNNNIETLINSLMDKLKELLKSVAARFFTSKPVVISEAHKAFINATPLKSGDLEARIEQAKASKINKDAALLVDDRRETVSVWTSVNEAATAVETAMNTMHEVKTAVGTTMNDVGTSLRHNAFKFIHFGY